MYRVSGRTAATAATAVHAAAQLWNPHTTQRIKLVEIAVVANGLPGTGASLYLRRSTARGTAGSTNTPDIDNDSRRAVAPVSGALLDLAAFTVQPTLAAGTGAFRWTFAAVAASGLVIPVDWEIPPGTGVALCNIAAVAFPISDISFAWREDW